MGQKISSTRPSEPISGATLMKGSVAGRKTKFVDDSTIAYTSFSMSAGSVFTAIFNLGVWPPDLPTSAWNATNIIRGSACVAWPYLDAFIDNDLDNSYYINSGSSLSADQMLVRVSQLKRRTVSAYSGSVGYTATDSYTFFNGGASTHTVYVYAQAKFIAYGDITL